MIEKPNFKDEDLIVCLEKKFALHHLRIEFLPLGVDPNSAVYRADADGQTSFFVKLRRGNFNETSVTLTKYLRDRGIRSIIAPLATRSGRLWANLMGHKVILYPYIEGQDAYQVDLTDQHWIELGKTLKRIHTTSLPPGMADAIRREAYLPRARETVRRYLEQIERDSPLDPIGKKLVAFLKDNHHEILDLVLCAERLAQILRENPPAQVLCHSDLHAGNILVDDNDSLYIVDWDDPIFAPKERDLMFPGGGQGFHGHTAGEEEALFYQGYGRAKIDQAALAYYRYERIIQDVAAFCDQVFFLDDGDEDREQAFNYLASIFKPGGTIEIAYRSDQTHACR